ncbi:hypothetical protein L6452_28309 [Arctium lappa]|uniref:Uncharacterized protein n=1 Tax=Arctium lappa TaxID=4217 RepID=A0ACB8ZZ33_ARCLA|nr:hypothetical protein L6452_28309 [Arctium lappa]
MKLSFQEWTWEVQDYNGAVEYYSKTNLPWRDGEYSLSNTLEFHCIPTLWFFPRIIYNRHQNALMPAECVGCEQWSHKILEANAGCSLILHGLCFSLKLDLFNSYHYH